MARLSSCYTKEFFDCIKWKTRCQPLRFVQSWGSNCNILGQGYVKTFQYLADNYFKEQNSNQPEEGCWGFDRVCGAILFCILPGDWSVP